MITRHMADIHFAEWPEFSKTGPDGLNSRLREQVEAVKRIATLPQADGSPHPQCIIIAGDLVHKRGVLTPAVQWALMNFFSYLAANFLQVFVIPGNHDYPLKAGPSWLHTLLSFAIWDNVTVCHEPTVTTLGSELSIALVPWNHDRNVVIEGIEYCVSQTKPGHAILCSHTAIHGAKTDNGFTYEGGLAVGDLKPLHFCAVILGDFHHAQTLGNFAHVAYTGSPYPLTRSDVDIQGGCLDVTTVPDPRTGAMSSFLHWVADPEGKRMIRTADRAEADRELLAGNYVSYQATNRKDALDWQKASANGAASVEYVRPVHVEQRLDIAPDSSPRQVLEAFMAALSPDAMGGKQMQADVHEAAVEVIQNVEEKGHRYAPAGTSLTLVSIQAENFWSYSKLDRVLDNQGLVLLEGVNEDDPDSESNGAGKSVIVEAVYWGLFGESLRGRSVDAMVKNGETHMEVTVNAVLGDGRTLEIKRGRYKNKPAFMYAIDGVAGLQAADPRTAQTELNRVMGWTPELFRQAALFGQHSGKTFSESTDAKQKEILESLLQDAGQYDVLYTEASAMLTKTTQTLTKMKDAYSRAEEDLRRENGLHDTAAQREKEFDSLQQAKVNEATAESEQAKAVADQAAARVSELEQSILEQEATLPDSPVVSWRDKQEELLELKSQHRTAANDAARIETQIKANEIKRDNVLGLGNGCPTCEQPVTDQHREKVKAEYSVLIADARKEQAKLEAKAAELEDKVKALTVEVTNLRVDWDEQEAKRAQVNGEVSKLRQELTSQKMLGQQKVQAAKEAADRAQRERDAKNTWGEARKEHAAQVDVLKVQMFDLEKDLSDMENIKEVMEQAVRLFGNQGLRCFLFDALSPAITQRANEALQVLTSGAVQLRLTTQRRGNSEKLVLEVVNELGSQDLDGSSGGQRRKVDLALAWAISGLVERRINVLFVDEAMDSLDAIGRTRAARLLQQRNVQTGTVICITHWTDAKGYFPRVWTARKVNGETRLESDERETNENNTGY